jgi:hypothetical protein
MTLDCHAQGTHLVPLAAALVDTAGAVLELGCGEWSTPFLQRYCMAAGRELLSLENYPKWAAVFGVPCVDYDVAIPEAAQREWSIVLVDHRPAERRIPDLLKFVDKAEIILLHDHHDYVRSVNQVLERKWKRFVVTHDTLVLRR